MHNDIRNAVADALKASFMQAIEASSGKPFAETGVFMPTDDIWLRYAAAALSVQSPAPSPLEADLPPDIEEALNEFWQSAYEMGRAGPDVEQPREAVEIEAAFRIAIAAAINRQPGYATTSDPRTMGDNPAPSPQMTGQELLITIKEFARWHHLNELTIGNGCKPSDSEIDLEVTAWSRIQAAVVPETRR